MEGSADVGGVDQELRHRVDRNAAHSRDRSHRRPLAKQREDLNAGVCVELVHVYFNMIFYAYRQALKSVQGARNQSIAFVDKTMTKVKV